MKNVIFLTDLCIVYFSAQNIDIKSSLLYLSVATNVAINFRWNRFQHVSFFFSGFSLAFVAYPQALSLLSLARVWSVVFFAMLFLLAIDSEVSNLHASLSTQGSLLCKERSPGLNYYVSLSSQIRPLLFFTSHSLRKPKLGLFLHTDILFVDGWQPMREKFRYFM